MEKFKNKRFVTKGVEENINPLLQIIMWGLIDQMPVDKDYLQVFSLSVNGDVQRIKHTQEVPEYCKEYDVIAIEPPITKKIFVIDDTTHSTMLLAEEY